MAPQVGRRAPRSPHTPSLRAIPGLITLRPGDANEVAEAWKYIAGLKHHPVCLVLSRQPMPTLDRTKYAAASGVHKGAYVLADAGGTPEVILMATGTEVSLAVAAHEKLVASGVKSRVVSMPSWEIFEEQDQAYQDSVLPPTVNARVCVELWERRAPFGTYNVTNPGFVTARQVVGAIQKALRPARAFEFWADDAEFYRTAAKTPRSNCVMDVTKLLATGVRIRPVEEALETSLRSWKAENA